MTNELREHRVLTQERQSVWDVKRTYTHDGHKMRVTIHHDPYEFQAHAYLELFNPRDLKWNRVHEQPTEDWYDQLNVLFIKHFTTLHLHSIDAMCKQLVAVGQDLLEGVEA